MRSVELGTAIPNEFADAFDRDHNLDPELPADLFQLNHISHSQLGKWQRCPRSWDYHYVQKIKAPKSITLVLGGSYHKGVEANYLHKIQSRDDLAIGDVLGVYHDDFSETVKKAIEEEGVDFQEKDPREIREKGAEMLKLYMAEIAPGIMPLSVESRFDQIISGVKVTGFIDLIDINGKVIDHKTSAKVYKQDDVDRELQPCAYGFGLGREIDFDYHVVTKAKQSKVQIIGTRVTKAKIDWWAHMAELDIRQMKTGIAPPHPNGWHCSPKWCGYWEKCRSAFNTTVIDLGANIN